ncbi:MAG: hypothetical protein KAH06_08680, partial [Desulfobacterales bacterium]|nr:hypothetical protein [Desulfobacterales bacterium]
SPCPGHYPRHLSTMASADACSLTRRITSSSAAQNHSLSVHLYFVSHSVGKLSIVCAGTFDYPAVLGECENPKQITNWDRFHVYFS